MNINRLNLVLVGLLIIAPPMLAHGDTPEARQWDFSVSLYNENLYQQAFTEFEQYRSRFADSPRAETALFFLGECSYQLENYPDAQKFFRQYLSISQNPDYRPRAHFRLGEIFYRVKEYADAISNLQEAIAQKLEDTLLPAALYFLGKSHLAHGQQQPGIAQLEEVIGAYPSSPYAQIAGFDLVELYQETKQIPQAIQAAQKAYELTKTGHPKEAIQALRLLGKLHGQLQQFEEALKVYQELEREFGGLGERDNARYEQAQCLVELNRHDEALQLLDVIEWSLLNADFVPRAHSLAGGIYFDREQWRQAYESYRKALGAIPAQEAAQWVNWTQAARVRAAWCALKLAFSDDARKITQAIIAAATDPAIIEEAYFITAESYFLQESYAQAQAAYASSLSANPQGAWSCQAQYKQAWCAYKQDQIAEAEALMTESLRACPDLPEAESAWLILAEARFSLKDWDGARTAYGQFLDKFPQSPHSAYCLFQRGVAAYNRSNWANLIKDYEQILNDYPDSEQVPDALYWIGYAQIQRDQLASAAAALQTLTSQFPEHELAPDGLLKLGVAQYQQNATPEAAATFLLVITEYQQVEVEPDILAWLGSWLVRNDQIEDGLMVLDRAEKQLVQISQQQESPARPELETVLAIKVDVLDQQKSWKKAGPAATKLVSTFPESPFTLTALYVAGKSYLEDGEYAQALAQFTQGLSLSETSQFADPYTVARLNIGRGDALMALSEYEAASKPYLRTGLLYIHPQLTPEALFKAGLCFEKLNQTEDAVKRFQAVVSDYAQSKWAEQAQEHLAQLVPGQSSPTTP